MLVVWVFSVFFLNQSSCTFNNFTGRLFKETGFPGGASGKEPDCHHSRHKWPGFDPWVRRIPWRRKWQSSPVFLPGESHGLRSLAGYGAWVAKSWTLVKQLRFKEVTFQLVDLFSSVAFLFSIFLIFRSKYDCFPPVCFKFSLLISF